MCDEFALKRWQQRWKFQIHPWNTNRGKYIVVALQSPNFYRFHTGRPWHVWVDKIIKEIENYTDRPIILRAKPRIPNKDYPNWKKYGLANKKYLEADLRDAAPALRPPPRRQMTGSSRCRRRRRAPRFRTASGSCCAPRSVQIAADRASIAQLSSRVLDY